MLIPFEKIVHKYNVNITGVLHCGASTGQEAGDYYKLGVKNMLFIEAIPDVYKTLETNISQYPGAWAVNACLSDIDDQEVTFNIANNEGQSSSLLEFDTHRQEHPEVEFIDKIQLKTKRLDTLISELNVNVYEFNFINLDLQCAELMALKGLGDYLSYFKYAYLEVNRKPLYKGCPMIGDIEDYMRKYGFVTKEIKWTNFGWGDAFMIKK